MYINPNNKNFLGSLNSFLELSAKYNLTNEKEIHNLTAHQVSDLLHTQSDELAKLPVDSLYAYIDEAFASCRDTYYDDDSSQPIEIIANTIVSSNLREYVVFKYLGIEATAMTNIDYLINAKAAAISGGKNIHATKIPPLETIVSKYQLQLGLRDVNLTHVELNEVFETIASITQRTGLAKRQLADATQARTRINDYYKLYSDMDAEKAYDRFNRRDDWLNSSIYAIITSKTPYSAAMEYLFPNNYEADNIRLIMIGALLDTQHLKTDAPRYDEDAIFNYIRGRNIRDSIGMHYFVNPMYNKMLPISNRAPDSALKYLVGQIRESLVHSMDTTVTSFASEATISSF